MTEAHAQDTELARVRELAVAFALGEIDEAGRLELHALLTGRRSTELAAAAWEQLDGTVDLRVQLGGPAFAEAIKLKLADDGTFARAAQRRIGARQALAPVETPPLRPRPWRRRLLWFGVPMLVMALFTLLVLRAQPAARVRDVAGVPQAAGVVLVPGSALDDTAPIVVPAGAALSCVWLDGSAAVISGPASAVVQRGGLSLVGGTAWAVAGAGGLTIGTPDRRLRLPDGARLAVTVLDGVSAVAVPAGARAIPEAPAPGRLAALGVEGAWEAARPVVGSMALPGPWWEVELRVASWGDGGRLRLVCDPAPELTLTPTSLILTEGRVARLSGPPAGARSLLLRLRGRRAQVVVDGTDPHELILPAPPTALRLERTGADGLDSELRIGPPHAPPLPLAGW
jgi:hypothetical protein